MGLGGLPVSELVCMLFGRCVLDLGYLCSQPLPPFFSCLCVSGAVFSGSLFNRL